MSEHTLSRPSHLAFRERQAGRVRPWEYAFIGIVLLLATNAVFPLLRSIEGLPAAFSGTDLVSQATWAVVYAFVLIILCARSDVVLDTPVSGKVVWIFVLLALTSMLWSVDATETLGESLTLLLTTIVAFYVATRLSSREIVAVLSWVLGGVAVGSVILALSLPRYGLDHLRGDAWSGPFSTKNELGRLAALSLLVWLLRLLERDGRRLAAAAFVTLSGALVVLSESRTAVLVTAFAGGLIVVLKTLRGRPSLIGPSILVAIVGAGGLMLWLDTEVDSAVSSTVSGDHLSGRRTIWEAAWFMIRERFWLGYGDGAFWRGLDGPSGQVWGMVGSPVPHAHNGLLDIWLDVGVVGVAIAAGALLLAASQAWTLLRRAHAVAALWPMALVVFLSLYNLTEDSFASPNSLLWILLAALLFQPTYLTGMRRSGGAA